MKITYLCLSRESGSFYVTIRRGRRLCYRQYDIDKLSECSKHRLDKVIRRLAFRTEMDVEHNKVFTYHYHNPFLNS